MFWYFFYSPLIVYCVSFGAICGKPRIQPALAVKNIKINFVFLTRLVLYLQRGYTRLKREQ